MTAAELVRCSWTGTDPLMVEYHDVEWGTPTHDAYVWDFVDGTPIVTMHISLAELPTTTDAARALAKDLKRRGFRFEGPTTVCAFMQAAGLVDDHVVTCFRRTGS